MEDILPGEIEKWQWLEEKARIFFEANGFKEIRTPILEPTELFVRSIGEASDIVHKEMYTFQDRGERNMTMRPEMTASVARSVIEKGLLKTTKSLRFYYIGPMFRAERPQAGRKRQFHQIGIEIINEPAPAADFEAIRLAYRFLTYVGVQKLVLKINDLGGKAERSKLAKALGEYFSKNKSVLCEDCLYRLEKNVLRILDCKQQTCQPVIQKAPWEDILPLSENFKKLTAELEAHKIPFKLERRLVRGLDYYDGIVFEIAAEGLGAQDAVAGGGRYDELYEELGGGKIPCTGFSLGIERLLTALEKQGKNLVDEIHKRKVYIAPLDSNCQLLNVCHAKAIELRERNFYIATTPGITSLSDHLKKANQAGARYALIMGPDEMKKGTCAVKDLDRKEQKEIGLEEVVSYLNGVMPS